MEAVHQVFFSLVEKPSRYKGHSAFTTWLYSATTHYCLNQLRNRKTRLSLLEQRQRSSQGSCLEGGQPRASGETTAILKDLLVRLPENLARVAIFYYLDEMTQDEIAQVMGCSRRKVGKLVERLHAHPLVAELKQ